MQVLVHLILMHINKTKNIKNLSFRFVEQPSTQIQETHNTLELLICYETKVMNKKIKNYKQRIGMKTKSSQFIFFTWKHKHTSIYYEANCKSLKLLTLLNTKLSQLKKHLTTTKVSQQAFSMNYNQCYKKKESSNKESKQKLEAQSSQVHKLTYQKSQ